ncbi:hypothetical protein ABPG72_003273 [Tetrahymena utriculariae]
MGCVSAKSNCNSSQNCPCKRRKMYFNEVVSVKEIFNLSNYTHFTLPLKCYIQPQCIKAMLGEVKWLKQLKEFTLDASNKDIGNEGFEMIAKSLSYFSHIKKLTLNLCFNFITDKHMNKFSKNMIHLKNLTHLNIDFWSNTLHDQGLIHFSEGLQQLTDLEELQLNLINTSITHIGSNRLGEALKHLTKISSLKLCVAQNQLKEEGILQLSEAIKTLKSLKFLQLDLFDCNLQSIEQLTSSFRFTQNILNINLNLGQNKLQNCDIKKLNEQLCKINSLEQIFLKLKNIEIDQADDIVMLRAFPNLKQKEIQSNTIDTDSEYDKCETKSSSPQSSEN